jgi:hypothetical protein
VGDPARPVTTDDIKISEREMHRGLLPARVRAVLPKNASYVNVRPAGDGFDDAHLTASLDSGDPLWGMVQCFQLGYW